MIRRTTARVLAILALGAGLAGCSRSFLEPPIEYSYKPAPPMREWRTDLTERRAYYFVDQAVSEQRAEAPQVEGPPAPAPRDEAPADRVTIDPARGFTF